MGELYYDELHKPFRLQPEKKDVNVVETVRRQTA